MNRIRRGLDTRIMAMVKQKGSDRPAAVFAFARHETFHLRDGWLFKGLNALQADGSYLFAEDAHHKLGMGINMLRSLIYWLQATNLVQLVKSRGSTKPLLELTPLARMIWEKDPYFEDTITLWLLHIELCSNRSLATLWYWAFNEFPQRDFTEERLAQGLQRYIEENQTKQIARSSIIKDVRCFLRTYISSSNDRSRKLSEYEVLECPLASLGLLRGSAIPGHYKFQVGSHRNLPASLFAYSLYRFRDTAREKDITLSLEDVRWAPLSPGRILCLDIHAISEYLDRIEHLTAYARMIRTADLNMIVLDESIRTADLLTGCYAEGY